MEKVGISKSKRPLSLLLFHHFLVLDRVTNVNVGSEGNVQDSWVQVDDIWRLLLSVEVGIQSLGGAVVRAVSSSFILALTCIKVVLPEPAMPMVKMTVGFLFGVVGVGVLSDATR